jgi:dyslexia susceptibility 1 candidate gene 1 protein
LFDKIDAVKHKATVKEGVLNLTLFKITPGEWIKLEHGAMEDKSKASTLREEANVAFDELQKTLDENKKTRKVEDERLSVRKQMAVDELERKDLENLKAAEKAAAEREVYDTFAQLEVSKTTKAEKKSVKFSQMEDIDDFLENDDIEDEHTTRRYPTTPLPKHHQPIADVEDENDADVKYIPAPRSETSTKIDINFTPRVFPTPLRESKAAEEENWVAKNRKHLKNHGTLGQNVPKDGSGKDISESDPIWLKAKGDDFFRSGDALSAISAYTSAIDADPNLLACYSNRAAAYMKVKMYLDCKSDCDQGIKLLTSDIEKQNPSMRLKLMLRRGVANCQLGNYLESLVDYHEAVKTIQLSGADSTAGLSVAQLTADIKNLEKLRDSDFLKKEGDKLFGERQVEEAIAKYSEALNILPIHVGCLSNRAASKLALNDFQGCIADCSSALDILQADVQEAGAGIMSHDQGINMIFALLPAYGSEKRKQYILKTITRRGVAYRQIARHDKAIEDYEEAVQIDPNNEALRKDLELMRSQYQSMTTQ